jgi:predicted metalloenzyme YecM
MGRAIGCGILLLLAACARAQAPRQSDAMERSARLLARLDQLEADLHQQDAELYLNSELEFRHGQAEQIACQVTSDHVKEIHRLAALQEEKRREKAHKKGRTIAQARTVKPARVATN